MSIDEEIARTNQRLKDALMGVQIEQRGSSLSLRATLPPKPDSKKTKPYQQRIALEIRANKRGLKRAEAEANKLGGLLACKEFNWDIYLKELIDAPLTKCVTNLIKTYEDFYFQTRQPFSK